MTGPIHKAEMFLEEKNLDAILVSSPANIRYLSGFRGGTGYLLLGKNCRVLMTDSRYGTQAGRESKYFKVVIVSPEKSYGFWLKHFIKEGKVRALGFEDGVMTYESVEGLKKAVGRKIFKPLGQSLNELRHIKTKEELECIRKAEEIGDKAFSYILKVIKPGMTEVSIALKLEAYMRRNGAERLSFDTIVASGENGAMPHGIPSSKKVENGEFITMDFGCVYNGYCSDMTRTVFLGKAERWQREVYLVVLEAQEFALDGIRAGVTGQWVDSLARDYITLAGYGEYFGHGLGHSLGLEIHEEPRLSMKEERLLQEGMVMTVEPGIYLPGVCGIRIEDLVQITQYGYINYTKSPKNLIEIV